MLYHMVVARKQVLVQLEDDLVRELDSIAADAGVNRSELLRRLVRNLVEAVDEAEADTELIAAYKAQPEDPEMLAVLNRLAAETAIDW